ncbi:hypothetical protein [Pseudovibrio sp. Ad46]|uniref:hypothetical protein n=1 Tax=Pseudovibrio sp. Ad46 TaxID=989432 RepID=UPI00128FCECA|nr:hypothetical protein [Pseudovibrio sp. Ad46]
MISLFLSLLGGLFTSTLATELTTEEGIAWSSFHTTTSFWLLLLVFVFTFVFHRYMHAHEMSVDAFQDAEYCMAYARSELLTAQVAASKKEIEDGNLELYEQSMQKIRDSLK